MVKSAWLDKLCPKGVFIIAEAGVNHNGHLALAQKLVDAAAAAGADAVKFQTFSADRLASAHAPKARYQKQNTGCGQGQLDMLKALQLNDNDHWILQDHCRRKKILFLSTAFDELSADFLLHLKMPVFKIPSGEITNWPYLRHVAGFRKPLLVSTGMADMAEVARAVAVIRKAGNRQFALLHCVSSYPAQPQEVNLRAMDSLARKFGVPVGFSDHTLGIDIAIAAAARGARVIEKHLTLDPSLPGPDQRMSLSPLEFKAMVSGIRRVSAALGNGIKVPAKSEADTARAARKSLAAARDIRAGEILKPGMIVIKRPGTGLAPGLINKIFGRRAKSAIAQDRLLTLGMFK